MDIERKFWRWWWYTGKDLARELWYLTQMLIVVTFMAWVIFLWLSR
jgi:hypothetical protein